MNIKTVYNFIFEEKNNIKTIKEQKINIISTIMLVIFTLFLIYNYVIQLYLKKHTIHLGIDPKYFANDFTWVCEIMKRFMPYTDVRQKLSTLPYGPFALIFIGLFTFFKTKVAICLYYISFCAFYIFYNIHYCLCKISFFDNVKNIFILSICSYPFWFAFDRGNIEFYLFLCVISGLFFYQRKQVGIASVFFVLATCMKIYPGVFLITYLKDKKYKEFCLSCVFGIVLTLISFSLFKDGSILDEIKGFMNEIHLMNILVFTENMGGMGLVCPFKNVYSLFVNQDINYFSVSSLYSVFSLLFLSFNLLFILKLKINNWQMQTLYVILICWLPTMSYDYKLLLFYIPLFCYVNEEEKRSFDVFYSILFALIMSPKTFFGPMQIYVSHALFISFYITIIFDVLIQNDFLNRAYTK